MSPGELFWGSLAAILGLVVPKDPRLVVFCGRHYGGNTAPLFEKCAQLGLRGVWLTRDRGRVGEHGALFTRSFAGVWAGARAGNVVLTHSLGDLNPLVFPRRATRIFNVWHGMPIKRISRADPRFWERAYARSNAREQARYEGMFVTSPAMVDIFAQTFGLPPSKIHVTGQPRNDVLLREPEDFEDRLPRPPPPHRRRILYCPTWRDGKRVRLFPFEDGDPGALASALEQLDAVLYVRTHPNDAGALASAFEGTRARVVPLQGDVVPEINDVLAAFDVLVTDYSSIYYDYLMLDRPTIFLPYDLDEYAESPGMYIPFDVIAAGARAATQAEFVAALTRACEGEDGWEAKRASVRDLVYARVDDQAARRVLEVIAAPVR